MARLDRLATVKALAQLGAPLGREFTYDLLQAVSPWDEGTLRRGLHQLVEAEFLYQQGLPPQAPPHVAKPVPISSKPVLILARSDPLSHPLCSHDNGGMRIGPCHMRQDRAIDHVQASKAMHPCVLIHYRHRV